MRSQLHFSAAEDELILYVHSELGAADRITAEAIDRLLLRCLPTLSTDQAFFLAGRGSLLDSVLPRKTIQSLVYLLEYKSALGGASHCRPSGSVKLRWESALQHQARMLPREELLRRAALGRQGIQKRILAVTQAARAGAPALPDAANPWFPSPAPPPTPGAASGSVDEPRQAGRPPP